MIAGTDIHPFARLGEWADTWAATHPADDVIFQHGYTPAPLHAQGVEIFAPAELTKALHGADVVVCHGGPGTISTVRASGLQPVVLARDPAFREHVDEHQLRFAAWAGDRGLAIIVNDADGISVAVEEAVQRGRNDAGPSAQVDDSVRTLGARMGSLLGGGPQRRRIPLLRRPRRLP